MIDKKKPGASKDQRPADIRKAAGLIVRNGKVLVSRNHGKEHFIQPGGKIEPGESPEDALIRELREEQQAQITVNDLEYVGTYRAIAAGREAEELTIELIAYLVSYDGDLKPSAEIAENRWIDTSDIGTLLLGSIMEHDVLPLLTDRRLIK
jgi:ADP-ribose pyrophosphatase YjhB (NUDIX family)